MRCGEVLRVTEKPAGDNIKIPGEKVTFTGMRLVIAVAMTGIGTPVKECEAVFDSCGLLCHIYQHLPVVFFTKELPALCKLLCIFRLVAAMIPFGVGEPVFPVSLNRRAFVFFNDPVSVQHILREIIGSGGVIRMSEEITEEPDVIKRSGCPFSNTDKVMERSAVFMQIRNNKVAAQRVRLSSAQVRAR